jgi:hypothetical protein
MTCDVARAHDESKYPDWSGQWFRTYGGNPRYDQTKPLRKQEAPLTADYQARFEASIKDQDEGGHGLDRGYTCLPQGMPRQMSGVSKFEFVFTPKITYMLFERTEFPPRRIYTDGRDWPKEIEPTLVGYSIGKWIDGNNDGHYNVLEVETRGFKGPRHYDAAGLPLHRDNQSVFKERIYLDKTDKNIMRNEITVYDHALTRPWTVTRSYVRNPNPRPDWSEFICEEGNLWTKIGNEAYFLSADGLLMPTRKDQPPPDLRYFKQTQK